MFGTNNAVSSTWGNNQPNQQQQQPSAFGQPAFGSGGAFGTTPAFGQAQQQPQQQQQQQQQPSMFGSGSTPGFGAFGSNPSAPAGGSTFGTAAKPGGFGGTFGGTGFGSGAFGGTGGSTSAFGNTGTGNAAGTSLFNTQPSNGQFGSGGGLFSKPATAFGSTQNVATGGSPPVTTGTATPFSPFSEKDAVNPSITLQYQSITASPAYRGSSIEELRWQDYQQGRKTAGAFGQTSFGATSQPSTGLFGQTTNQPAATGTTFGGFGSNTSTTNPPGTTSAFGTSFVQSNPTGGLFGGGGGAFGQQPQQPQQPQQQQQPAFGGAFGQTGNQQPSTGIFGGGAFGNNNSQPKPSFGFGTTGAFGQTQSQQQQPAATGLFGQTQQQQPTGNNAFGSGGGFGSKSIFGTAANQPSTSTFNTNFGQSNPPQQQQQGTQPISNTFGSGGLFGQANQQPQQQQQQPQQQGGGPFGTQPSQPQTGGGLFGGNPFGSSQQQPQQGQGQQQQNSFGGLFGPKPATTATQPGGLFGNGFGTNTNTAPAQNQPTTNLFGNTTQGQQPQAAPQTNAFGGWLGKPTAPPLGTSTSTGQSANFGGSLFGSNLGASTANLGASTFGQPQAPLTASIAQPIGTNLPIFSMLPPGPRAVMLDQQPKKKPGHFVDVPTRSPVPQLQLRYAPASTKLRGFGSTSTTPGAGLSQLGSSLLFASGNPNALSLSKASTSKSLLGPDAFLSNGRSSPTLGSGARQSVKKLTLDKKVDAADLFSKSTVSVPSFNPKLSIAAREMEAAAANLSNAAAGVESPIVARSSPQKSIHNRFVAQTTSETLGTARPPAASAAPGKGPSDPTELQEGEYWVKPDLDTLKKMGHDELMSFTGLVVGRVGYGEITFLEPVDLTGLPRLSSLLGEIVRFDDKECSVYPDADEAEKPPPGSGLNVRARIELVRCWALDKASREPIKDESHPAAQRHSKRLRNMKHTHFEGFDVAEGKWTFSVDHF